LFLTVSQLNLTDGNATYTHVPPPHTHTGVFVLSLLALALSAWLVISTVLRKRRERRRKRAEAFDKLAGGLIAKNGALAAFLGSRTDHDASSGSSPENVRRKSLRVQLDETTAWGRLTAGLLRKSYGIGELGTFDLDTNHDTVSGPNRTPDESPLPARKRVSRSHSIRSDNRSPIPARRRRSSVVHGIIMSSGPSLPGSFDCNDLEDFDVTVDIPTSADAPLSRITVRDTAACSDADSLGASVLRDSIAVHNAASAARRHMSSMGSDFPRPSRGSSMDSSGGLDEPGGAMSIQEAIRRAKTRAKQQDRTVSASPLPVTIRNSGMPGASDSRARVDRALNEALGAVDQPSSGDGESIADAMARLRSRALQKRRLEASSSRHSNPQSGAPMQVAQPATGAALATPDTVTASHTSIEMTSGERPVVKGTSVNGHTAVSGLRVTASQSPMKRTVSAASRRTHTSNDTVLAAAPSPQFEFEVPRDGGMSVRDAMAKLRASAVGRRASTMSAGPKSGVSATAGGQSSSADAHDVVNPGLPARKSAVPADHPRRHFSLASSRPEPGQTTAEATIKPRTSTRQNPLSTQVAAPHSKRPVDDPVPAGAPSRASTTSSAAAAPGNSLSAMKSLRSEARRRDRASTTTAAPPPAAPEQFARNVASEARAAADQLHSRRRRRQSSAVTTGITATTSGPAAARAAGWAIPSVGSTASEQPLPRRRAPQTHRVAPAAGVPITVADRAVTSSEDSAPTRDAWLDDDDDDTSGICDADGIDSTEGV
jgi:hypothetical protein